MWPSELLASTYRNSFVIAVYTNNKYHGQTMQWPVGIFENLLLHCMSLINISKRFHMSNGLTTATWSQRKPAKYLNCLHSSVFLNRQYRYIIHRSTDSTLKKWSLEEPKWSLTYKGHTNVRNFVGLSVDQKWIACGSENNHVYVYHADGTTPVASFGFPTSEVTRALSLSFTLMLIQVTNCPSKLM